MNRVVRYLAGLSLMVMSCGEELVPTALEDGWTFWQNGLYPEAHAKFIEAGEGREAKNGLGWTTLKMDSLDRSEGYFVLAAVGVEGDTLIDAMAGLTLAAWQQGDHALSLQAANYVLRTEPEYEFDHDPTITELTIILAKAYDEYHLGRYAECIASIHLYEGTNTFNPTDNIARELLTKLDELSDTGK